MKSITFAIFCVSAILYSCSSNPVPDEQHITETESLNKKAHELGDCYLQLVYNRTMAQEFMKFQRYSATYYTNTVAYKEEYERKKLYSEKCAKMADSVYTRMVLLRKEIPNVAIPSIDDYGITAIRITDDVINSSK